MALHKDRIRASDPVAYQDDDARKVLLDKMLPDICANWDIWRREDTQTRGKEGWKSHLIFGLSGQGTSFPCTKNQSFVANDLALQERRVSAPSFFVPWSAASCP